MVEVSFQPLKIRRLSEMIENSIKDLIISGELKAGSKLPSEKEIRRQFDVSVVTVREALRDLEAYGVIQKKRGKDGGIFVTKNERDVVINAVQSFLSQKNFSANNLSEVRIIIEPAAVRVAADQITQPELKDIEDVTVGYREKETFGMKVEATVYSENRVPILLRDIADVSMGYKEVLNSVRINGVRCVGVAIYKEND